MNPCYQTACNDCISSPATHQNAHFMESTNAATAHCCPNTAEIPCCPQTTPCSPSKLEPPNIPEFPCSPKMCSIFGGHDLYRPETHACIRSKDKHTINCNTLGNPVGLVQSSFVLKTSEVKGSVLHSQRFATYLKAFAKIYLTPEIDWNTAVIDMLLAEGQRLYTDSLKLDPDENEKEELQSDIYSTTEARIKRLFSLDGFEFQIELTEKFHPTPNPIEIIGDENIPDLPIEHLRSSLKQFFRQAKYCLVKLNNWYLLVWKSAGVYFVLDFYGRRIKDFVTDREKGMAMLVCLKALENVCHLITNLSGLQRGDLFNLRETKVVRLTGPDGKTHSREYGKRVNQYEVISSDYAFVKATLHLTLNIEDPLRTRSALPVAVAALLASKIDHPATWNQKILDKLICYGVNICQCCWEQCLHSNDPVLIEQFPTQLKLGQFLAKYCLISPHYEGIWKCVPNYKNTELAIALEKSFKANENNLIVQIGHQMYAVWKKNNFIYLFDPYRHRIFGNLTSESASQKSASLRMFRTFDTFMSVFNHILLESNRTKPFIIHKLVIQHIALANGQGGSSLPAKETKEEVFQCKDENAAVANGPGGSLPAKEELECDENAEVKSLNETICFEEDEIKCKAELGEISDYEDEDITVGFRRIGIEEKSETEESDEDMEEEEGGVEDTGEYESSSSGGGDSHRKRKKKKGGFKPSKDTKKNKADRVKKNKKTGKGKGDKTDKKNEQKNRRKKTKKDMKDKDKTKEKPIKDKEKTRKRKNKREDSDQEDEEKKVQKKKKRERDTESDTDLDKKKKMVKRSMIGNTDQEKKKKKESKEENEDQKKKQKDTDDKNKEKEQEKKEDTPRKPSADDKRKVSEVNERKSNKDNRDMDRQRQDKEERCIQDGRTENVKKTFLDDDQDQTALRYTDKQNCCKPNNYPGYTHVAHDMAVVGSESGSYESICKLLRAGFKCADRVLTMTPWGNYIVFRGNNMCRRIYFLFDGCTCNVNRFRHLDLNCGTAGLLCFQNLHDVITYIIDSQRMCDTLKKSRKNMVDEICRQYC